MPSVTVAIPAYKPAYLGQAIASVLAQTHPDFELLISDDCPDDSVRRVVERFRDPRIRIIQGPRGGLVANSAHLWENAACDLLKFVYDDDFLLPFCLADLVDLIGRDPALTYAFCGRYYVDEAGRILHTAQAIKTGKTSVFIPGAVPETLLKGMANPIGEPVNVLIRRSAFADSTCLSQYGGIPVRHHIDVAFYLNAGERGSCAGSPAIGAAFRRHGDQATSQRTAPNFAYSAIEWEIFTRAAVSRNLVGPAIPLTTFERLSTLYSSVLAGFPEIAPLADGLPSLRSRLERGDRDLLDTTFLTQLERVDAAIAARPISV